MDGKLKAQLVRETTLEDIAPRYRDVAEIVGIEKFILLSEYALGDELYFPKVENVLAPARNRRLKKEYNGGNVKELADKYGLTVKQVSYILRNVPHPEQMSIFDWMDTDSGK